MPDSVLLVDRNGVHAKSSAALRTARLLTFPWPLLAALGWLVPRPLRDALYDLIARNRTRWFGRQSECMVPTERDRQRFLAIN
jgi:predicted DCC family thiol-disulfide oxidoreductase YuxK